MVYLGSGTPSGCAPLPKSGLRDSDHEKFHLFPVLEVNSLGKTFLNISLSGKMKFPDCTVP